MGKRQIQFVLLISVMVLTAIGFQNCGEGFSPGTTNVNSLQPAMQEPLRAPGIEILARPNQFLNSPNTEISFRTEDFNGGEITSTDCSYNQGPFEACESPVTLTELQDGQHQVMIRVTTSNDQQSSLPVSWSVDLTPAMVAIQTGPNLNTLENTASFTFTVTDLGSGIEKIECRINDAALALCVSPVTYANLQDGPQVFEIIATDRAGNTQAESFSWSVGRLNRAIVLDQTLAALISVDLATGNRTIVSSAAVGSGPNFVMPTHVALHARTNTAYVTDRDLAALIRVNLATGDRTIASSANVGAGPLLDRPKGVVVNSGNTLAYVSSSNNTTSRVDLVNGNRTFLPGYRTGPDDLVLNANETTIYGADGSGLAIISFDLANNTRRTHLFVQASIQRIRPLGLVVNSNETEAIFVDASNTQFSVRRIPMGQNINVNDPDDIQTLSGQGVGQGPEFMFPSDLWIYPQDTKAYVVDRTRAALIEVDLATGNRRVVSGSVDQNTVVGDGPNFLLPESLEMY